MKECPADNWIEFTKSGDLSNILKPGRDSTNTELSSAADRIRDELFEKFGFPEDLEEYLQELNRVELLRCEWILTDNESIRRQKEMWMEIHSKKATNIMNSGGEADIESIVVEIEKAMGREVDLEKISIYKFKSYIKSLFSGKKNN